MHNIYNIITPAIFNL